MEFIPRFLQYQTYLWTVTVFLVGHENDKEKILSPIESETNPPVHVYGRAATVPPFLLKASQKRTQGYQNGPDTSSSNHPEGPLPM